MTYEIYLPAHLDEAGARIPDRVFGAGDTEQRAWVVACEQVREGGAGERRLLLTQFRVRATTPP